jgi:hypothetical protein
VQLWIFEAMTTGTHQVEHDTTLTSVASYVAATVGFFASIDWEKSIYIALAVATFAVNWYYNHQRHLREEKTLERPHHGKS